MRVPHLASIGPTAKSATHNLAAFGAQQQPRAWPRPVAVALEHQLRIALDRSRIATMHLLGQAARNVGHSLALAVIATLVAVSQLHSVRQLVHSRTCNAQSPQARSFRLLRVHSHPGNRQAPHRVNLSRSVPVSAPRSELDRALQRQTLQLLLRSILPQLSSQSPPSGLSL